MKSYNICYLPKGKYNIVIYSICYENPINELGAISNELANNNVSPNYVLFDLLACNGESFNRYAVGFFDGERIDYNSIDIAEVINPTLARQLNKYYSSHCKFQCANQSHIRSRQ